MGSASGFQDRRTDLLAGSDPFCAARELLGHYHLKTPMIYTHVLNRGGRGVNGPADLP